LIGGKVLRVANPPLLGAFTRAAAASGPEEGSSGRLLSQPRSSAAEAERAKQSETRGRMVSSWEACESGSSGADPGRSVARFVVKT
jgi:hypothetical protein